MASRLLGRLFLAATVLGGLLAPAARAAEATPKKVTTVEGITEYRLPNGLRVLLFPDDSKPIVTVNMTVFVGSRQEGYGETGMAHLLEHMLFKGTPTHPNVPKALRDHGARNFNGTTWVDRTNYYETMPATDENLEFGISLEADRLVNSFVKREDLVSEMTVVRNEFEMGENNPEHILSQRMMAVAYEWHNYGKSTIGNRTDIERVPIDNLKAFYKKYYRVDNAMVVVAGKFDEKKALDLILQRFGPLKHPADPLPDTYTEEPPQDGERIVVLRRVGSVGAIGAVYHVPAGPHPEFAAVEVLDECLTSAPSGRVYKALVETKKATSVNSMVEAWHDPGLIEITAKVEPGKVEAARDALVESLENFAKEPITEQEVERAKTRYAKFYEDLTSDSAHLAIQLSDWAACGDWRLFFLNRDRIEKVTAADVNRVAAKYLTRNNRTLGVYYPAAKAERAAVPETPKVADLVKGYQGHAAVAQGEAFDPTPENIQKRVSTGQLGGLKTAYLPKKTRGELVQVRLNLRYGNPESLKGKNAAADLLGPLLRRGTKKHDRQQLTDALDRLGAQLGVGGGVGLLQVTLQVKKPNLPAALELVGEVLREPAFPGSEFEILRRENLERINRARTEPTALASQAFQRKLTDYPKDDVRYVPTFEEALARYEGVKLDDVRTLYEAQLGAQTGELVAVGDFDPAQLDSTFAGMLKGWKSPVAYQRIEHPARPDVVGGKEEILTPDKANAVYIAGLDYPQTDAAPDYPALVVGNYLLGAAPLASRLSNRVRGKEGLSYGIGSRLQADPVDRSTTLMIFAITNPKNIGKVDDAIADEIKTFLANGVSLGELNEGKKAYTEQLKVQRSDDASLAQQLATSLYANRTYAYYAELEKRIGQLTPDDVNAAFKKVLDPKKLVIIEAGDLKK